MKRTIILAGVDGYIGNALAQRLLFKGYRVIGIDNFLRRAWVKDTMGSFSATPILSMEEKTCKFKEFGDFEFYNFNIADDYVTLRKLISENIPDTIINLAHIPSGPFSQISYETADLTLKNNYIGTNNMLWAIKELCPSAHYITIGTTGEYDHYSNIDIEEGYIKITHNGRESGEMIYPRRPGSIYHSCYDDKTEILTDNGWKLFKDLCNDDLIATLNKNTDTLEYQRPTNTFEYDYNGELININTKSLCLAITPNHKIFESSNYKNTLDLWRLTEALNIYNKSCVMKRGVKNWEGIPIDDWVIPGCNIEYPNQHYQKGQCSDISVDIDAWLLFFGWWVTEGSIYKNDINISQRKEYNFESIVKCLSVFGRKVQTNTSHGEIHGFSIKHYQLAEYLRTFGKSIDKYIPKGIKNLPKDKLLLLLNTLLKGDGYINVEHYKLQGYFSTISKRLADDVQEIAFKCGYAASINTLNRNKNTEYVVNIVDCMTSQIIMSPSAVKKRNKNIYSKSKYKGKVYCVEVPNSIVYVRRNGKSVWSGNSKTASTYLIDLLSRTWGLKCTDIQQSVVFGAYTEEIEQTKIYSRLDSDEAAGTVINRFIVQAVLGVPLTVYGEGKHQRGFLSLNDSVQAMELAVENPPEKGETQVWNQLSEWHSMNTLAEMVKNVCKSTEIIHIPTPRIEHTGEHYYKYITQKLAKLGYKPTRTIKQEIEYVYNLLMTEKERLLPLKEVVMPKIIW